MDRHQPYRQRALLLGLLLLAGLVACKDKTISPKSGAESRRPTLTPLPPQNSLSLPIPQAPPPQKTVRARNTGSKAPRTIHEARASNTFRSRRVTAPPSPATMFGENDDEQRAANRRGAASASTAENSTPAMLATVPDLQSIVARMEKASADNQRRMRRYTVVREYDFFGADGADPRSQVIAQLSFIPPDSISYVIQRTRGSHLGEKLVRRILEGEVEIARRSSATDLSRENYDFRYVGEANLQNSRCYVLELEPKRKDKDLLRGKIWVDAETYLLRRAEGEPARNPSFWVHDVHIVLHFGEVGGMWLQTGSEATATARLLGRSSMVLRDVKYDFSGPTVAESG